MSAGHFFRGRNRAVSAFAAGAAGLLFFFVVVFVFRFEENRELYATASRGLENPLIIRTTKAGQAFRLSPGGGQFNRLTIALHNPLRRDIPCRFTLKTGKNGRILYQTQFVLKRGTNRDSPQEITLRPVRLDKSRNFYFELDSRFLFGVVMSSESPGEGFAGEIKGLASDRVPFFRVTNTDNISLFSWAFRALSREGRPAAILFIALSLGLWLSACRFFIRMVFDRQKAGAVAGERYQTLTLTLAALSLFCLIGVMLLADANTHARLLGAEDDAHITYRYALNIAEGKGFRFNAEEKILGTTTPLYTLILALLSALFGKPHVISLVVNLVSILGSGLLVNRLLSRRLAPVAGLAGGLVFIFFPMFYRILGMETNFLVFLILAGVSLLDEGKIQWAAFVFGLAVLTRMEAVLLWPPACLFLASRKEYRKMGAFTGVFLLTLVPWHAFSLWYFGKPLPNTFYIKTIGIYNEAPVQRLLRALSMFTHIKSLWLQGFINYLPDFIQHYAVWAVSFLIALIIAARDVWRTAVLRLFLFWTVLCAAAYIALGIWLFVWYYVLAFAIIPLVLAVAINRISECAKNRRRKPASAVAAGLLFVGLMLFEAGDVFDFFTGQWLSRHTGHVERYETYVEIARFIRDNIPSDQTVAMEEIGILGYFIPNKVWDFYSLVHDPRRYHEVMPGEKLPLLLTLMDPDYLVLNSERLASRVAFLNYEEVKAFSVREYPWSPFFHYSLLRKKPGSLVPCGDVYAENRLSGSARISGWIIGSEAVKSVMIIAGGRMIARTDILLESPDDVRNYAGKNPFSQNTVFHLDLDTTQLPNGVNDLEFWAGSGSNRGIFYKKRVIIAN